MEVLMKKRIIHCFFIAVVLVFGSCTGKEIRTDAPAAVSSTREAPPESSGGNSPAASLAPGRVGPAVSSKPEVPPQNLVKVFSEAGLSLLKVKVSPREFSLPLALPESSGQAEKSQSLAALKGKVVFLNFWATWCGPCRAEMPSMEALYKQYKEKGLEILAVNCRENPADVTAFMKDNGLSFPAALDVDGRVSDAYSVQAIPTTFLLDREGKIIMRLVGSLNWDTPKIRAALEQLLE
jgi:thiol-disulfide isomerase/thioredoxin